MDDEVIPTVEVPPTNAPTPTTTSGEINSTDSNSEIDKTEDKIEPSKGPDSATAESGLTAQIPVSEPFGQAHDKTFDQTQDAASSSAEIAPPTMPLKTSVRELLLKLEKARSIIQIRKRKKLDKIMSMFEKSQNISNDNVEKFLHISDATATRYLEILVKESKIKKDRKGGKGTTYTKI